MREQAIVFVRVACVRGCEFVDETSTVSTPAVTFFTEYRSLMQTQSRTITNQEIEQGNREIFCAVGLGQLERQSKL